MLVSIVRVSYCSVDSLDSSKGAGSTGATRVQIPKENWAGLADALAVQISGEALLAA